MNRKQHEKIDELLLGYSYPIHQFLDDSNGLKRFGPGHRIIRHNEKVVSLIFEIWGEKAGYCALLHLLVDFDILMLRSDLRRYI